MQCKHCSSDIPADSEFCPFCGKKIEPIIQPEPAKSQIESSHTVTTAPPPKVKPVRYCKKCGGAIDANTKKCKKCGKQYFKLSAYKNVIAMSLLSLLLCVSLAFNFYQVYDKEKITELYNSEKKLAEIRLCDLENVKKELSHARELNAKNSNTLRDYKRNLYVHIPNTRLCHTMDCSSLSGYAPGDLNIILWSDAEYEGYSFCPLCTGR